MLLSLRVLGALGSDFGYLLHKNPTRTHEFELTLGKAYLFYPEVTPEACEVVLLLEIDPIHLAKNYRGPSGEGMSLASYVNDRPYVASSFLSVAISRILGTALQGRCTAKPELVGQSYSFEVFLPVLPCYGGESFFRALFEPLGYTFQCHGIPLDEHFPEWGASPYYKVFLQHPQIPLAQLLSHLYVLLPVLDNSKHYWVSENEIEKLLKHGSSWLGSHPEREKITQRYLRYQKSLTESALTQLDFSEILEEGEKEEEEVQSPSEETLEKPLRLNDQRMEVVFRFLKDSGVQSVLDFGCGEGQLLQKLLGCSQFQRLLGVEVSYRELQRARRRLRFEELPSFQQERLQFLQGSLVYWDPRLEGYEAVTLTEVIEHLDPFRLETVTQILLGKLAPPLLVFTTPNREYNVKFPTLQGNTLRHPDHRFEWTRHEFQEWSKTQAQHYGYTVDFFPIGEEDLQYGSPTQMGVFRRCS